MCFGRVGSHGRPSILTMGLPMMSLIWLATLFGSFIIFMVVVLSACVWMVMSPLLTIRPIIDCAISRSEKPEGERTNDFRLAIPVLTSRLPLLSVYLLEVLRRSRGMRLTSQAMRNRSSVSVQIGTPKIAGVAAPNANSSQITTIASARIRMVLARALGRIQGLPVQSVEPDGSGEVDKLKTC